MRFRSALRINPFAKLLLFYLSGIISGSFIDYAGTFLIWLLVSVILFAAILLLGITVRPAFHTDRHSGFLMAVIFVSAGLLSFGIHDLQSFKIRETSGFKGTVLLQIEETLTETPKTVKCIAGIKKVYNADPLFRRQQKILAYFEKDSLSIQLKPGDRLHATLLIREIQAPMNPDEFDYRKFLASKGVINQAFVNSDSWELLENNVLSPRALSFRFQQALLMKYRAIGLNPTLFSILSAVTLGYKNDLDTHTRQAFSKAGVMHVMALSGFNVAVIAVALNYLLFFANRIKYGNYFRLVAVILFIWFFAFITGFSSSVIRASLMISLVLAGKEFRRSLHTINILYASAFILLAIQPALIYDIGFQLSFAAVFGIIVFQSPLEKLIHFNNRICSLVWQLFTVSFAAQLATMPLTIAYFHQFPVYFWITNLYVVPLVSAIISVAMIFLILSFVTPLMLITGRILGFLVAVLYKSISIIEIMPFSIISSIRISNFQLILLLALLIAAGLFIYFRKRQLMLFMAFIIITLLITGVTQIAGIRHQQIILVGHLKNSTFINLVEGKNSLILSDVSSDNPSLKYSFGNFWVKYGIHEKNIKFKPAGTENMIFRFAGKTILLVNSTHSGDLRNTDLLILTGRAELTEEYLSGTQPSQVILDSSVPRVTAAKWKNICRNCQISCYCVNEEGAWMYRRR